MYRIFLIVLAVSLATASKVSLAQVDDGPPLSGGNRLTYLDEYCDPYYPHLGFAKLTTPAWVGDNDVDAVVTLAIDDMRDSAKYEAYLRPILERLKQIDGRAPVSVMSCSVDPEDPLLQTWLDEGLSIEVHTIDHPCPCLQGGDFEQAKATYEDCVDLMASVEGNHPVAFRMPCCDSRNTPSPRFWMEVFNRRTKRQNFLQIDSSVFNVFTGDDLELPKHWLVNQQGEPRFKRYIPFPSFVNTIENYPYPYVIAKRVWQFPCVVPSDWEAQNIQRPNNPQTVDDLKVALDATVKKQGVFNLVFHPHGWIRNDQIVELIDYAFETYGDRVLFLNFNECVQRINSNLLDDQPIRHPDSGDDNGVRLADVNNDGHLDVLIGNDSQQRLKIWQPSQSAWLETPLPVKLVTVQEGTTVELGVRLGKLDQTSPCSLFVSTEDQQGIHHFRGGRFTTEPLPVGLSGLQTCVAGIDQGVRLRDLDNDGICEVIVANPKVQQILQRSGAGDWNVVSEDIGAPIVDADGQDAGVRFIDLDRDRFVDVVAANGAESTIQLYDSGTQGFTRRIELSDPLPPIVREGANNGVWFAREHMWVQNEDTHRLPDNVDRRTFGQMLGAGDPPPKSAQASLDSIRVPAGFEVELVAAEPLVQDPVAIDFGSDGRLWVAEMADYPLGIDDRGEPGGRIRFLEDKDGDGIFDKSTLFLDQIPFPTGVMQWRDGVIVSAAPEIFFAADRDGDGKAEVREVLYRGFTEGNQQHRVNGFRRGLDNWVYLANGDSDGVIESLKTGQQVDIRGRDLRIRPDTGEMDPQAGRTQFGRHRDDHGNWFGSSNPLPLRHYILSDHYQRRNPLVPSPAAHRDIVRVDNSQVFPVSRVLSHWSGYKPPPAGTPHRFTSACSTVVYRDQLLGREFVGNTFTCEPVHNLVHRRKLIRDGISFRSERPSGEASREFLASSDSWFRPTMATTGTDGALWVVDMYRAVIEHPEWIDDEREKQLFLRAGHDRGRIYRIYPKDERPGPLQELSVRDAGDLIRHLGSTNGTLRDLAQQLLIQRGNNDVTRQLRHLIITDQTPLTRLHALCVLDGLGEIDVSILKRALSDVDPTVQRHAIRLSESFLKNQHERSGELIEVMSRCHQNPHVQLQLASSLGFARTEDAVALLAEVANRNDSLEIRAAVISSLGPHNYQAFYQSSTTAQTDAGFRDAIMAIAKQQDDFVLMSRLIDDVITRVLRRKQTRNFEIVTEVLEAVGDDRDKIETSTQVSVDEARELAEQVLAGADAAAPLRAAAVGLLATDPGSNALLEAYLAPSESVEVQIAVARALSRGNIEGRGTLLDRFSQLSPKVRVAVVELWLSRANSSLRMLDAVADGQLPESTLSVTVRQRLLHHPSKAVREVAQSRFGETAGPTDNSRTIRRYLSKVNPRKAQLEKGEKVFAKSCSACHRLRGLGHAIGPDLSALKNRSPDILLTAIVTPNAAVEDKYQNYNILLDDGVILSGVIASESTTTLDLSMKDGKQMQILRSRIERIQNSGLSMMPDGLHKEISPSDMNHLLAYLDQVGPSPKAYEGNVPAIVTPSDQGNVVLPATKCRIFGDEIRFEPRYKNIGYWVGDNDYIDWSIAVEAAGDYEVVLSYACADQSAGNQFRFTVGSDTLLGNIESTGSWEVYRDVLIGKVSLPSGTVCAALRPRKGVDRFLMDFRSITLRPVPAAASE